MNQGSGDRIKKILENVTTEECAKYFIAANYEKTCSKAL